MATTWPPVEHSVGIPRGWCDRGRTAGPPDTQRRGRVLGRRGRRESWSGGCCHRVLPPPRCGSGTICSALPGLCR